MYPLVRLHGVRVDYGNGPVLAVDDLVVEPGERVALVGPSGAGKTTLLRLCNGSIAPTEGTVEVLGHDLARQTGRARRAIVARIGTVYQQLHLVGPLRVVHNVNAGRLGTWSRRRALWSLIRPAEIDSARAALARVGIATKMFERTDRLSGGEQQRVALARVVVQAPVLVLADEPVSSLDPARSEEVMALLSDVAAADGAALVVSLHDFALAQRTCDRMIGLREGRLVFDDLAASVTPEMAEALYRLDDRSDGDLTGGDRQ